MKKNLILLLIFGVMFFSFTSSSYASTTRHEHNKTYASYTAFVTDVMTNSYYESYRLDSYITCKGNSTNNYYVFYFNSADISSITDISGGQRINFTGTNKSYNYIYCDPLDTNRIDSVLGESSGGNNYIDIAMFDYNNAQNLIYTNLNITSTFRTGRDFEEPVPLVEPDLICVNEYEVKNQEIYTYDDVNKDTTEYFLLHPPQTDFDWSYDIYNYTNNVKGAKVYSSTNYVEQEVLADVAITIPKNRLEYNKSYKVEFFVDYVVGQSVETDWCEINLNILAVTAVTNDVVISGITNGSTYNTMPTIVVTFEGTYNNCTILSQSYDGERSNTEVVVSKNLTSYKLRFLENGLNLLQIMVAGSTIKTLNFYYQGVTTGVTPDTDEPIAPVLAENADIVQYAKYLLDSIVYLFVYLGYIISQLMTGILSLGSIFTVVFAFLPAPIINLICLGLGITLLLRILGR